MSESIKAGWLIERIDWNKGCPVWAVFKRGKLTWTSDPNEACRFSRCKDAEQMAPDNCAITEHEWDGGCDEN